MEKDGFFGNFNCQCDHIPVSPEMEMNNNNSSSNNSGGDQSQSSIFVNLNWDQSSTDQTANFESALSSLVSSPSSSNPNPNPNLPSFASSADSFVIRELIGRLGSICNSNNSSSCAGGGDEISPPNSHNTSSCYSTPLNSPPKLNLDHPHFQFARPGGDQGADRGFAARFSCFGTPMNYAQFGPSGVQEPGKLSTVSSSKSLKTSNSMMASNTGKETPNPLHLQDGNGTVGQLENDMIMMIRRRRSLVELGNSARQQSSMVFSGSEGIIAKKRKAASTSSNKGNSRGKEAAPGIPLKGGDEENSNSKRCKSVTEADTEAKTVDKDETAIAKTPKIEQNSTEDESSAQKQGKEDKEKESNVKPPEPPKQDYIHVRARRGQATDSHSLAERIRREKISERMKFLQDLVPGCNKVTGKAVMLDEIINYVQSLQRQVEFLSMKLATVNPWLDFNLDSVLSKDIRQPRGPMMLPQSSYQLEAVSTTGFSYAKEPQGQGQGHPLQSLIANNGLKTQCSVNNPLDVSSLLGRSLNMQLPPLDVFTDAAVSQLGALWEEDLQSVVQMRFGQNQQAIFSTHDFQGTLPTSHMKIEL